MERKIQELVLDQVIFGFSDEAIIRVLSTKGIEILKIKFFIREARFGKFSYIFEQRRKRLVSLLGRYKKERNKIIDILIPHIRTMLTFGYHKNEIYNALERLGIQKRVVDLCFLELLHLSVKKRAES